MSQAVNTAHVADRRKLRFNTIDEMLADVDRIVAADKAGTLRRTGNWTAGQTFGHLATWVDYGWNGFPTAMKVPWIIRLLIRMKKKAYVRDGMPAGVRIPRVENGTYATEVLSTDEGAARIRTSMLRLKNGELAKFESPAFGPMSHQDRVSMMLRHAELHMSFLHP